MIRKENKFRSIRHNPFENNSAIFLGPQWKYGPKIPVQRIWRYKSSNRVIKNIIF